MTCPPYVAKITPCPCQRAPPTPTLSLSLDEARVGLVVASWNNVPEMRDKMKGFFIAQGMSEGHSRSGVRGCENDLLILEEDNSLSSQESYTISSPLYHASGDEELYYPAPLDDDLSANSVGMASYTILLPPKVHMESPRVLAKTVRSLQDLLPAPGERKIPLSFFADQKAWFGHFE
ncbi:hypothetical protein B0H14DRAFT_2573156 [Mycena olivaceomarginata]|nr:hypothetical protein B0H14DRAFT_2573156 [Mycena olivaceomarginata]